MNEQPDMKAVLDTPMPPEHRDVFCWLQSPDRNATCYDLAGHSGRHSWEFPEDAEMGELGESARRILEDLPAMRSEGGDDGR